METKKLKYFCKYLPVEGEIKEGDKFLFKSSQTIFTAGQIENKMIEEFNHDKYFSIEDCKKVKLFLCCRNIQVGDKVKYKDVSTEIEIPIDKENWSWLSKHASWSVIGEISTDAVWVKEGNEFAEDEIEEWYWHIEQDCFALSVKFAEEISNKPPNFHKNIWENRQDIFKKGIYRIKCPCCKSFL